jgi:hypothetical protein
VTPRRELAAAVAGCVLAGALLLFVHDGTAADAWARVAFGGVVAIAATRGRGRWAVGAALAVAGSFALGDFAAAGALLALTGALVGARGARWPALGARYDAPAGPPSDADLWRAMDRGEDPTAGHD